MLSWLARSLLLSLLVSVLVLTLQVCACVCVYRRAGRAYDQLGGDAGVQAAGLRRQCGGRGGGLQEAPQRQG